LIAAVTGSGKSYLTQAIVEANLPDYPLAVVFDYKDEYRGLVLAGLMKHFIVGPDEAEWSVNAWAQFLHQNPKVVLARFRLNADVWREVAGRIVAATREIGARTDGALLVLDEAHFLAPQRGSYPDSIKGVATTGRGEGVSGITVTQRLSELDETIISQSGERLLGPFQSDADLSKVGRTVGYPKEVHNPQAGRIPTLPEELHAEKGPIPLRKFQVGSEWIYSDIAGNRERRDSREVEMKSEHVGAKGNGIVDP
jgi:hypothetical protein